MAGKSEEEEEAKRSCIRAFFLLSCRVGPRADEALQGSEDGVILVERPAGRLRRLSHDAHATTHSS